MTLIQSELQKCYIGIPSARLPSVYQEVEWIENTSTSYINTGLLSSSGYKISLKFYTSSSSNSDQTVIGAAPNSSNCLYYGINYGYNNGIYWNYNNGWHDIFNKIYVGNIYEATSIIRNGHQEVILDGVSVQSNTASCNQAGSSNMTIFARGGSGNYALIRLYSMQIYDVNDVKLRDFVPCYRKLDSVIGLYDLVTNTFYTNAGGGTFTKGADVNVNVPYTEIKKIMKGTTQIRPAGGGGWTPGANTIAYYPLDAINQLNDMSGNGYDLTTASGYTFGTYQGVSCVSMTGNYDASYLSNSSVPVGTSRTALAWIYCTRGDYSQQGVICTGNSSENNIVGMGVLQNKGYVTDWYTSDTPGTTNVINGWHLIAMTRTSGEGIKLYIDGQQEAISSIFTRSSGIGITIGSKIQEVGYSWSEQYQGYISNVILENKARTAQETSNYYNQTKSNYGL